MKEELYIFLKRSTPTFWGLLLIASAILVHAQNGRYQFISEAKPFFSKFDTRSGDGYFCSSDECVPINPAMYSSTKR